MTEQMDLLQNAAERSAKSGLGSKDQAPIWVTSMPSHQLLEQSGSEQGLAWV